MDARDLLGLIKALNLQKPFVVGHSGGALAALYVAGPGFYQSLPEADRRLGLQNALEWELMLTRGSFFEEISPARVRSINARVLLVAGSETNAFLMMIHETLRRLIPNSEQVIIDGAPHPMFATHPRQWNEAVLKCLAR